MIISASRRTDIPACHSEWFFERLHEGYAVTRNPMNAEQVRCVELLPDAVDGFVFWTKNAAPMLGGLEMLSSYKYYFQFTVTPYGTDVERGLPDKRSIIIPAFRRLAELIGPERVIWRYDPIFISERYGFDYHVRAFTTMCELLGGRTRRVTVSFVVPYRSVLKNIEPLGIRYDREEQLRLAEALLPIACSAGIEPSACCDEELAELGYAPAKCIDSSLFGLSAAAKDKNQRKGCNCSAAIDIGAYSTCFNGCLYCYARSGSQSRRLTSPGSPELGRG